MLEFYSLVFPLNLVKMIRCYTVPLCNFFKLFRVLYSFRIFLFNLLLKAFYTLYCTKDKLLRLVLFSFALTSHFMVVFFMFFLLIYLLCLLCNVQAAFEEHILIVK